MGAFARSIGLRTLKGASIGCSGEAFDAWLQGNPLPVRSPASPSRVPHQVLLLVFPFLCKASAVDTRILRCLGT